MPVDFHATIEDPTMAPPPAADDAPPCPPLIGRQNAFDVHEPPCAPPPSPAENRCPMKVLQPIPEAFMPPADEDQCCVFPEMCRVYDSSLADSLPTIFMTVALAFALGALTGQLLISNPVE